VSKETNPYEFAEEHGLITTSEVIAAQELNVKGYSGKWKVAKKIAVDEKCRRHLIGLPYWERVRNIFLELGGERLNRKPC
jgi:hypothetical protein